MPTEDRQPALPLRPHTILGVCEAIGEDFGFNPIFIRVPFATMVLLSPPAAIAGYLLLGLIVLASRLLVPASKAVTEADAGEANGAVPAANDGEADPLRAAA